MQRYRRIAATGIGLHADGVGIPQGLKPGCIFDFPLLQQPQAGTHNLAGILVMSGGKLVGDKAVILVGQIDVSCRREAGLLSPPAS